MEWTETLCRETGIRFLTTRPSEIEAASFAIIKEELGEEFLKTCPKDQLPVLCRVIHTTADFSYKESLYFSEDAVSKGREALASGIPIITDTTMAASGINKTAAAAHGVQFPQQLALKEDGPAALPVGRQGPLQLPQEGALPAARWAAEHHKFTLPDGQREITEGGGWLFRVGKGQMVHAQAGRFPVIQDARLLSQSYQAADGSPAALPAGPAPPARG